jgi:peptide/nickel transport system permease protein
MKAKQTSIESDSEAQKVRSIRTKLDIDGKPLHLNIVSLGSFILISMLIIYGVDAVISVLMNWLSRSVIGFDFATTIGFTTTLRVIGIIILIMTLWIGFLGKPLYEKRPAEIVLLILKLSIILLLLMAVNIGMAIIVGFVFFFWDPPQLVDWDDNRMTVYRSIVIGGVGILMILESFLTVEIVGFDPFPSFITLSIAGLLGGFSWIAVGAAFIIIPLYIFIPRLVMIAWGLRKGIESFWKEFVYDKLGLVGFFLISFIVLLAVLAPYIAPYHWSYTSLNQDDWFLTPSLQHPFGTNHEGGDIFSRVIWGAQVSLLVGFTASIVAVVIGTLVGLLSGYYGGLLDSILMRITDMFLCLPTLPLMLIFLMFFGQGLQNVIIVIAILGWTGTARMVRSEALSLRERPLTEAAHAIGASDNYILFRHIMPNTLPLILANVIIGVVNAILSEAGISFLGFMPIHAQPSWGIVLYWASRKAALVNEMWWWIVPPGLMIMLTTVGFAFVSHAADKVVNPRLRGRRG